MLVGGQAEGGAAALGWPRRGPRRQYLAVPQAAGVIAQAAPDRKPVAIHARRTQLAALRILNGREADGGSITIAELGERDFQIVDADDFAFSDIADDGTARNTRTAEPVTRIGHKDTANRQVEMARLLVGQVMQDRIAGLDVSIGSDAMQIFDRQRHRHRVAAPGQLKLHFAANATVHQRIERLELRQIVCIDAQ